MSEPHKEIRFLPGFDYRDEKNDHRGAAGVNVLFVYRQGDLALTARINTGWMLRPLTTSYARSNGPQSRRDKPGLDAGLRDSYPTGHRVDIHALQPIKDWWHVTESCDFLGNQKCYNDGGYLVADEFLKVLIAEGNEGAWKWMADTIAEWSKPDE